MREKKSIKGYGNRIEIIRDVLYWIKENEEQRIRIKYNIYT